MSINDPAQNHTFALCAYKESPYLEDCVQSLLASNPPTSWNTETRIIIQAAVTAETFVAVCSRLEYPG